MSTPASYPDLAIEIARIRTELHAQTQSVASIADSLKVMLNDHESRLRKIETDQQRALGVLKLLGWLGAPATAGIVLFIAQRG